MAEFELVWREAEKADAADLIRFLNQVGAESDYMTLDEAGILMDEDQMAQFIQRQAESDNQLYLLALLDNDEIGEGKRKKLVSFLELFFKNYTTSQANLDLISKDIKSIGGATFKSLDYTYFKEKDGKILAYAQITLDVAGTTHSENFSFELRKDKDSYFVEKMDHTIPADFNKKDDDKGE